MRFPQRRSFNQHYQQDQAHEPLQRREAEKEAREKKRRATTAKGMGKASGFAWSSEADPSGTLRED